MKTNFAWRAFQLRMCLCSNGPLRCPIIPETCRCDKLRHKANKWHDFPEGLLEGRHNTIE